MMRASVFPAALLIASGCAGNTIGPENQLEVTNNLNDFQFQVTALDEVSETLTYPWPTTGSRASIDHSSAISAGSATLVIRDSGGTVVYERDLAEEGVFETTPGTSGVWEIAVRLDGVSGTVNFRVQTLGA